jgi:tryptophan 2-monooxygenase
MPDMTPQSLGRYVHDASIVGNWSVDRADLARQVVLNLHQLTATLPQAEQQQLHHEITLHWHCLGDEEKSKVLEELGKPESAHLVGSADDAARLQDPTPSTQRSPIRNWLDHTFFAMPRGERDRHVEASSAATKRALDKVFSVREDCPALESHFEQYRNDTAIDTLYDYTGFMLGNAAIGSLPESVKNRKVAIVGAGAAGLCAGFELNKVGADVTIIEATGRIGGRMDARRAAGTDSPSRFEMGAMRFPPSGKLFFHYLDAFNVPTVPDFPNPGKVPTKMFFQGRVIDWKPGELPNDPVLQKVGHDFESIIGSLAAPMEEARNADDVARMRELWQDTLDKFSGLSFKQATSKLLAEHGIEWGDNEFAAFGALGVGTGGFGPLYGVGFLEILRVVFDGHEKNQHLLPKGTTAAMEKFASTAVARPDGKLASLNDLDAIRLNTEVTRVSSKNGKPTLTLKSSHGEPKDEQFDAVIFAASPRSAEHAQMTLNKPGFDPVLDKVVAAAIEGAHLIDSSKLFIKVKNRFWEGKPEIPQTIQTDKSLHGAYCLAYPGSEHGVVLVSYTWLDKSAKLEALTPEQRLASFRAQIEQISPEFAANLVPMNDEIHCIDWQKEPHQYGAFKLDHPGTGGRTNQAYSQFQSVLPSDPQADSGVYLAGDGVSYKGGWVVGALDTGINAACAAVKHLGGEVPPGAPLMQETKLYQY